MTDTKQTILTTCTLFLAACGTQTPQQTTPTQTGNPAVYTSINTETNCTQLQQAFNTAANNHETAKQAHHLDQMQWTTGYMTAIDERMKALNCYK